MTLDVLGLFEHQHRRLVRGMEELSHARQARRRRTLFAGFQAELREHFRLEERLLFPRAQPAVLTRDDADLFVRGRAEHSEHLRLLAGGAKRLEDASAISVLVFQLARELREHFQFEEERVFPAARRALGRPTLLELARELSRPRTRARRAAAGSR